MIDNQPITLFWDSSSSIEESSLKKISEAGFKIEMASIVHLMEDIASDTGDDKPRVVCLNSHKERRLSESYIQKVKEALGPKTYLILRVERDDVESAIVGVRAGADDVICVDAPSNQWRQIASSARMRLLKLESYVFVDELSQKLLALVERVGASDVTALLQGPTGSGKEVLARLIHDFSARRDGPFVAVNCAALPESLAESLLFGHVKGSFTGATKDTEGFFTQADGGTLFLDEIGELQPMLQAKLLRVMQEREVLPVGSARSKRVDVRLVSATNRDLRHLATLGDFREDLYFRLSTFRINVPSLSARPDDILPLANYFIVKHCRETQRFSFEPDALSRLIAHDWPGNVRELENVVQRSIVLARGDKISSPDLIFDEEKRTSLLDEKPWAVSSSNELEPNHVELADSTGGLQHSVEANEFRIIAETVRKAETKQEAAKLLGISDRTLRYKLAKMRDRGILPKRAAG